MVLLYNLMLILQRRRKGRGGEAIYLVTSTTHPHPTPHFHPPRQTAISVSWSIQLNLHRTNRSIGLLNDLCDESTGGWCRCSCPLAAESSFPPLEHPPESVCTLEPIRNEFEMNLKWTWNEFERNWSNHQLEWKFLCGRRSKPRSWTNPKIWQIMVEDIGSDCS